MSMGDASDDDEDDSDDDEGSSDEEPAKPVLHLSLYLISVVKLCMLNYGTSLYVG